MTFLLSPQIVLALLVSSLRVSLRQATSRGVVPRIPQKLCDSRDPSVDDLRRGCRLGWGDLTGWGRVSTVNTGCADWEVFRRGGIASRVSCRK